MGIALGAVAEQGMTVAWNGAAWKAGGVLGGGIDAADDTEDDEDSDADDIEPTKTSRIRYSIPCR